MYFFSDDSAEQRMRTWDAVLRASGWTEIGADGPEQLPTSYVRALADSSTTGQSIELTVRWVPRSEVDGLFGPASESTADVAWIQKTAVPTDVVESAVFSHYRFVALASLTVDYYGPDAEPASLPTATSNGWSGQCGTGSGTCN